MVIVQWSMIMALIPIYIIANMTKSQSDVSSVPFGCWGHNCCWTNEKLNNWMIEGVETRQSAIMRMYANSCARQSN